MGPVINFKTQNCFSKPLSSPSNKSILIFSYENFKLWCVKNMQIYRKCTLTFQQEIQLYQYCSRNLSVGKGIWSIEI